MLRIGICEDDKTQKEYILQQIQSYYDERSERTVLEAFESAEELMFKYPDELPFDCLILDIKMKSIAIIP